MRNAPENESWCAFALFFSHSLLFHVLCFTFALDAYFVLTLLLCFSLLSISKFSSLQLSVHYKHDKHTVTQQYWISTRISVYNKVMSFVVEGLKSFILML